MLPVRLASAVACVLYIPASLEGFGFGALLPSGEVAPLWNTSTAWAGILGGAFIAAGGGRFLTQPTLSSGASPLATLTLAASGARASVSYAALAPVPGHESLGSPAVVALAADAAATAAGGAGVGVAAPSALAVLAPDDGSFSYYAVARLADTAAAPVAAAVLRDITAEVAALGGALQFGEATTAGGAHFLYLAMAAAAAGDNTSTVLRVPLANASAAVAALPLPAGAAAVSLQYSAVVASAGGPGVVALAQTGATGELAWLALTESGRWAPLFSYAPGSATAPEIGVGAASADGATLFALVVDADGGLAASAVDVATQTERLRVRVLDKGLIAVDIAECAAEG